MNWLVGQTVQNKKTKTKWCDHRGPEKWKV